MHSIILKKHYMTFSQVVNKANTMKKICILGLGYVGLTLAVHAARNGYEVHGVEVLEATLDTINSGHAPFHEPGIDRLIQAHLNDELFIYSSVPSHLEFDVIIISVGTPLSSDFTQVPNLQILSQCIQDVTKIITQDNLLILRSTVPVGTSRKVEAKLLKQTGLQELNIAFCPERTAEGNALAELRELPQVISGNSSSAIGLCVEFFNIMVDELVETSSLEEAEITKLFNNVYRDSIFSLSNTFSNIAQEFGIDGKKAIINANYNYPRSSIPLPGFVGGPCLEKDAYILASNLENSGLKEKLLSARNLNEQIEDEVAEWLKNFLSNNLEANVLVSGIAFKGDPATNDIRGSSSVKILNQVEIYKDRILCHDMMNSKDELEVLLDFRCLDHDFYSKSEKTLFDLIVILNNHKLYESEYFQNYISKQILNDAIIFDAWGKLNLENAMTLTNYRIKK